jgi:ABC-type glutathione transport system ATPase component
MNGNNLEIQIHSLSWKSTPTLFNYFRKTDKISSFNMTIEAGKIYGIVGPLGSGGWLLSSLLCGRDKHFFSIDQDKITVNGYPATIQLLENISCYIGEGVAEFPYRTFKTYPGYIRRRIQGIKTVYESIQTAINSSNNRYNLTEIAKMFELTGLDEPGRIHRPFEFLSGERWRASLAIGFAFNKQLYCAPWLEPDWVNYILSDYNIKYIKLLKEYGASIVIPVSREDHLKGCADQVIYLEEDHCSRNIEEGNDI